jgi:hypothetical protein
VASNLDLTIKQGDTLNPVILVAYTDDTKTVRVDLTGVVPEALVKTLLAETLVADLEPTIEDATDYTATGIPTDGEVVVIELTDEQTELIADGAHKWECRLTFPTGTQQTLVGGAFCVLTSVNE